MGQMSFFRSTRMAADAPRPTPTERQFPSGCDVKFRHQYEFRRHPVFDKDNKYVGRKQDDPVPEGTFGVVVRSGDCDPYPTPYSYVRLGSDKVVLIEDPSYFLKLFKGWALKGIWTL